VNHLVDFGSDGSYPGVIGGGALWNRLFGRSIVILLISPVREYL
jgi:hypothetical protein